MSSNDDLSRFVISENDFEIGKLLGKGSYAHVFAARSKTTKEIFALKKFHSNFTSKKNRMMFEREVSVMAKLIHSCVLGLRGYFLPPPESDLCPLILMDYMKNGDLFTILVKESKNKVQLGWDNTKRMMNVFGIAYGMAHIHACGGIHRDLKPANIMLNENFEPKIADFGLAKIEEDNNLQSMIGGSPFWMAPELFLGEQYTNKVDVYAYGVLLYQLLTDLIPFDGKITTIALGKKITSGERPPIPETLPTFYSEIITACWAQEPESRPTFEQIYRHILEATDYFPNTNVMEYRSYVAKVMNGDNNTFTGSIGDPFKVGMSLYEKGDYQNASVEFEKAARSNNIESLYYLGKMIIDGKINNYDKIQGIKFLKKAAEGGHAEAQYECGMALYKGEDVGCNKIMAAEFFKQAAKSYLPGAIIMLSKMLLVGDGVEMSKAKSKKLLQILADKQNVECAFILGKYSYTGEFGEKDLATAEKYLEFAANSGNSEAKALLDQIRREKQPPKSADFQFPAQTQTFSQNPFFAAPSYNPPPQQTLQQVPPPMSQQPDFGFGRLSNVPPYSSSANPFSPAMFAPNAASFAYQQNITPNPQPDPYQNNQNAFSPPQSQDPMFSAQPPTNPYGQPPNAVLSQPNAPQFDPFGVKSPQSTPLSPAPQQQQSFTPKSTPGQPVFLNFGQQSQQSSQLNFSFLSGQRQTSQETLIQTPPPPAETRSPPKSTSQTNLSFDIFQNSMNPPSPSISKSPSQEISQSLILSSSKQLSPELKKKAESGDINAMYEYALILAAESNKYSAQQSAIYMKKAADKGHLEAKYQCGNYLVRGFGTKQDLSKAAIYFYDAAKNGHSGAMLECSNFLSNGMGVKKDLRKAAYMCKLSAESGNVEAMYTFANIVKNGQGVQSNSVDAHSSFVLAADRGHVKAMLAAAYYMWTVEKDLPKALKYYKMAADQQDCDGLSSYGHFLAEGLGCNKDPVKAAECFRAAALMGSTLGMYNYAVTLQTGNGVERDITSAAKFYKMAADRGDVDACIHYSQLLATGWEGNQKDLQQSANYAKKAADLGNPRGMFQYGKMLWYGTGVQKRDQQTAASYIKEAAARGYSRAIDFCREANI
ncbi:TKL family protein kinase [Trichomonas vaginalis G3]|uniref:TKL family protein kinase n=1 Tax=Trichomonas vaginalis (strain ATCC PRA-98 / G3) TaxID=412133 RepID=A2FEM8_TRIV3|nr:protein kinase protein [Trichomonas vaginalis G3]EAX96657.1 TKL family protein kinase [Trichomonas vaginalis G3]KAI5499891.1 protein kinase protein [Trichomonas vaginalis G3]|eukprot:XP_001309587.1 TKL family protein kinase [Trichomonas vaginalis G3]